MFHKETIPVSFNEEYKEMNIALRALNDTLVFLVKRQTEEGDSDNI